MFLEQQINSWLKQQQQKSMHSDLGVKEDKCFYQNSASASFEKLNVKNNEEHTRASHDGISEGNFAFFNFIYIYMNE